MSTGLIVALDNPDLGKSEGLARMLGGSVAAFKVGGILFAAHGPEAIAEVGQHGRVFCDLKLHDIPSTVEGTMDQLGRLGVWMVTVHASGGAEMVQAASEAAARFDPPPHVAAVTVLTSLSAAEGEVESLGARAVSSGAGALITSTKEIESLRARVGDKILLVVPGIRPAGADINDQMRTGTPKAAAMAGADYIVVGRPITAATDPKGAAERILEELS